LLENVEPFLPFVGRFYSGFAAGAFTPSVSGPAASEVDAEVSSGWRSLDADANRSPESGGHSFIASNNGRFLPGDLAPKLLLNSADEILGSFRKPLEHLGLGALSGQGNVIHINVEPDVGVILFQFFEDAQARYLYENIGHAAPSYDSTSRMQGFGDTPISLDESGRFVAVERKINDRGRHAGCFSPRSKIAMAQHLEKALEIEQNRSRNQLVVCGRLGAQSLSPHGVGGSLPRRRGKESFLVL
jgi:hypothetical protein